MTKNAYTSKNAIIEIDLGALKEYIWETKTTLDRVIKERFSDQIDI